MRYVKKQKKNSLKQWLRKMFLLKEAEKKKENLRNVPKSIQDTWVGFTSGSGI